MINKFVSWDVDPLETLAGTRVYQLHEKIEAGKKLNREEKDYLFELCEHGRRSYHLRGGWCFNFIDCLNHYAIKRTYGSLDEVYAPDKMAIRNSQHGSHHIHKIYLLEKGGE